MQKASISAKENQLLLVVASRTALAAAGLDIKLIDAVPLSLSSTNEVSDGGAPSPAIMIGRLKTDADNPGEELLQLAYLRQALETICQIPDEQIAQLVEPLQPLVDHEDRDRFKKEYGVLTIGEMAVLMNCTPEKVRDQEAMGEIFSAFMPGFDGQLVYPTFQLDARVDKVLLKQIILKHREANVSTTMLWSFLRSPQKIFADWTPMEIMLGAMPPAYVPLTPKEWTKSFLDVVAEYLSRVR